MNLLTLISLVWLTNGVPPIPPATPSLILPPPECQVMTGINRFGQPITWTNCPVAVRSNVILSWPFQCAIRKFTNSTGIGSYAVWPSLLGSTNFRSWYVITNPGMACRATVPVRLPREFYKLEYL